MKIGIIGDGQLGRMLILAGIPLGFKFGFLGVKDSPSGNLGEIFDNILDLENFADIISYESEDVNMEMLEKLHKPIFPPKQALFISQHRGREKAIFAKLNINCANSIVVTSLTELKSAIAEIGIPSILKTTTEGYDGKGQFVIKNAAQIKTAWQKLNKTEAILEAFVDFEYEISLITATNKTTTKYYPITKNTHKDGILRKSEVIDNYDLQLQAQDYANKIIKELDYIGVLTIEFFVKNGLLIINEIAPRVHNSGHWSIDGAKTSQFENHLRAIANLPLGDTKAIYKDCTMLNLIGKHKSITTILADDNAHLHLYNKISRPNRKIGHINICK